MADAPFGTQDDLDHTTREVRRLQASCVVVAGPQLATDYLAELVGLGVMVMAVDNSADLHYPNPLILNPYLAPSIDTFSINRGTQILNGARYALVRPAIRRMRPLRSQEPPSPYRVMLALGDDDPQLQSLERTKQLLDCPKVERVDVAVRAHHPQLDELRALAEEKPGRLDVITEPGEVGLRVPRVHFAITGGDSWALEMACVGVPQLILLGKDKHLASCQRLEEEGVATLLGSATDISATHLRQAVQGLLMDPEERQSMARNGRQLIDGRGPDRIVNALEIMLHPSRPAQEQRLAA
jgi:spore coat polysaccharide biosynthesis predicted glycosyltransferase SpsG